MKYLVKVYYRTPLMDKITSYMQRIMPDWERSKKHLEGCRTWEFTTDRPLTDEEIAKIKAAKPDFAEAIDIEELTEG